MAVKKRNFEGAGKVMANALASGRKILLPDEAMEIVRTAGIFVPECVPVKNVGEAVAAAKTMGFPVALKIVSPDVLHKSDVGGVVMDVKNAEEVERSYKDIMNTVIRKVPGTDIMGMLVEKQFPKATETIVGGIRDGQFGPAVMFGLGGIFVELFKDVVFRIAPVTEKEAMEMIREIRGYPLLSGYRGREALDIQQLAGTIVTVSELITEIDEIKEVELNPLLVYAEGVIAVDARIILT